MFFIVSCITKQLNITIFFIMTVRFELTLLGDEPKMLLITSCHWIIYGLFLKFISFQGQLLISLLCYDLTSIAESCLVRYILIHHS